MAEDAPTATATSRAYRSPLRERQTAQTREMILRAVADEILENGIHGLSIAAVAARAEVAERTVYRHFANVDALIDALTAMVGSKLGELLGAAPRLGGSGNATVEEMIEHLPQLYLALDQIGAPARALAAITLARGSDQGRRRRRAALDEALEAEFDHLPPEERKALAESMHVLGGSVSWFLLTRDGLTGEQAGLAAARIMRAVLADIRAEKAATKAEKKAATGQQRKPTRA